jgi:hypothetical protein
MLIYPRSRPVASALIDIAYRYDLSIGSIQKISQHAITLLARSDDTYGNAVTRSYSSDFAKSRR